MADIGLSGSGLGLASLALQVGDSIMRLKGFWDAVKDAPEEIKHLIEEIEILTSVIGGFETAEPDGPEPELGTETRSKCVQLCRKAANTLSDVVNEVQVEIKKRRTLGSVKAVLKKAEIARLRERLLTAQSMLMLSHQLYLGELQKQNRQTQHDWAKAHQHELQHLRRIVTHSTETILSSTSSLVHTDSLSTRQDTCSNINLKRRNPKQKESLRFRFRTPKWLSGVSRAIEIYDSHTGWDFHVHIYNVVPSDAPIFRMIWNGDIAGIQQLFSLGQASPFDCDFYGETLLDRAARSQQSEVCRFLRNQGADPNISYWGSSAVVAACVGQFHPTYPDPLTGLDIVQFLAKDVDIMDPFDEVRHRTPWVYFYGHVDTLAWILQESNSTYKERSLDEVVPFLLGITGMRYQPDISGLVRIILADRELDEAICRAKTRAQNSLLHNAARNLGEILSEIYKRPGAKLGDLLLYITDLIKAGSELHALNLFGKTPMLEFLDRYLDDSPSFHMRCFASAGLVKMAPPSPLQIWLTQLQKSGIDLAEYGREEERIFRGEKVDIEWECRWFYRKRKEGLFWDANFSSGGLRLMSFTYGSEISDWGLWFTPVMEEYFMDFWGMIAHPERAMPGAWEQDYYDEDQY